MVSSRRKLTYGERILLHISMFHYDEGNYEAPYHLCQDGIAEALGILKNNVSREIGKLKKQGLIDEKLSRVKGAERRRNIYQPTNKGEEACGNIKRELGKNKIHMKGDSEVIYVTVKDAVERLKKDVPEVDPFHVTEWMRTRDVLDSRDFALYHRKAKGDERLVELMASAPLVKSFYGRRNEIRDIVERLSGDDPPIIIITGIPGIGKSTLAARVTEELKGKKSLFWYIFHPWGTRERLVDELMEFLKKAAGTSVNAEKIYGVLTEVLDNVPEPVFFFDNCEKTPTDLSRVFGILLELKKRKGGLGAVLMSREKLAFYDVRDTMNGDVIELEIGPLDEKDVESMTEGLEESPSEVYRKTRGHPLYVEIYKRFQGETGSMDEFIEREMYLALDSSEKNLMKKLAVLLDPCEREIVLDKGEEELLLKLKSSHLVEETRDGKLSVHSILKEHIYSRLSITERDELHTEIGRAMVRKHRVPNLEILYHFEKGRCWKEALGSLKLLKDTVAHLHEEHRRELMELFPNDLVPKERSAEYYELKGNIHLEAGEWEKAVECYRNAGEPKERGTVMEKMGEAQRNLRRWEEALETHKKTLDMYRNSGDREGEIRELLALGTVYRKKGELDKAKWHYEESRKIIEKENIQEALGPLCNNMGLLYVHRGEFATAEEQFKRALEYGESGIVYENLAELYRRMGARSEVLSALESALERYTDAERWSDVSRLCLALGNAYNSAGEWKKATNTLKKGLANEKEHRRRKLFGRNTNLSHIEIELHRNLADSLRKHHWRECLVHRKIVVDALAAGKDKKGAHRAKLELAFDLRDSGDTEGALEVLKSLEKELQGEKRGLIACKLEEGRIYQDIGRYKDALNVLEEGLKLSRDMGENLGISTAEDMIKEIRNAMKKVETS
ncbi:MAG: tetratricopeptide repeat protein [Thermoplasmata archaeon]